MKTNQSVRMSLPKARKIISENEFLLQDRLQKIRQIVNQYGEDVTEKWATVTQNASALEKAYKKGYYDAMQRQLESEDK